VHLAGDLHHYRRHAHADGTQKITAGGGSAVLIPPTARTSRRLPVASRWKAFPAEAVSRRLTWRNVLFPIINPRFGWVTGSVYALVGWWWQLGGLGRLLGPLLIISGFILFTDTHSPWYRRVAGSLHGAAHLIAAYALGVLGVAMGILLAVEVPAAADVPLLQTAIVGGVLFGRVGRRVVPDGPLSAHLAQRLWPTFERSVFGAPHRGLQPSCACTSTRRVCSGSFRSASSACPDAGCPWRARVRRAQLEPDDPRSTPPGPIEPAILV
jgi:hypothetical protein